MALPFNNENHVNNHVLVHGLHLSLDTKSFTFELLFEVIQ